jgi:hypothetical protein
MIWYDHGYFLFCEEKEFPRTLCCKFFEWIKAREESNKLIILNQHLTTPMTQHVTCCSPVFDFSRSPVVFWFCACTKTGLFWVLRNFSGLCEIGVPKSAFLEIQIQNNSQNPAGGPKKSRPQKSTLIDPKWIPVKSETKERLWNHHALQRSDKKSFLLKY